MNTITLLPTKSLVPHPDNPRKDLGDLTELVESVKANGIMQNLTVVPVDDGLYRIIIGHRRFEAAKLAGLEELPCSIVEMTPQEQIATMLLENLQRADLTIYEQAQGFQMMLDFGETVETIAAKTGFSKATIRRRVKLGELDKDTLIEASQRQISMDDIDQLNKVESIEKRNELLQKIGTREYEYAVISAIREEKIKKKLPDIKAALRKAKAKAIENSDTYSGKYERIGVVKKLDDIEGELEIPDIDEDIFYRLDSQFGNYIEFYKKVKKAPKVKKSPEEIARESDIENTTEQLNELTNVAYQCRVDFVKKFTISKKNHEALLKNAAEAIVRVITEYTYLSAEKILELNDMKVSGYSECNRILKEEVTESPLPLVFLLIYSSFGDKNSNGFFNTYLHEYPKYKTNSKLVDLYAFLEKYGYEMSEIEKQLMAGTHELFAKGKAESEAEKDDEEDEKVYDGEHGDDGENNSISNTDDLSDAAFDDALKDELEALENEEED